MRSLSPMGSLLLFTASVACFQVPGITPGPEPATPPPEPAPEPHDPAPEQLAAPGMDWYAAVKEYKRRHQVIIEEALAAVAAEPDRRAEIVEAAVAQLYAVPGTLGPANAALPSREPWVRRLLTLTGQFRALTVPVSEETTVQALLHAFFAIDPHHGVVLDGLDGYHLWVRQGELVSPGPASTLLAITYDERDGSTSGGDVPAISVHRRSGYGTPSSALAFVVEGDEALRARSAASLSATLPGTIPAAIAVQVFEHPPGQRPEDAPLGVMPGHPWQATVVLANVSQAPVKLYEPDAAHAFELGATTAPTAWQLSLWDENGELLGTLGSANTKKQITLAPGESLRWTVTPPGYAKKAIVLTASYDLPDDGLDPVWTAAPLRLGGR